MTVRYKRSLQIVAVAAAALFMVASFAALSLRSQVAEPSPQPIEPVVPASGELAIAT